MASDTAKIVTALRPLVPSLVLFSFVINLAVLISPIYMMQVLDRVIPSGNLNTLMLLLFIAVAALITNALVEYFRDLTLGRAANWVECAYSSVLLRGGSRGQADNLRHVATVRDFLATRGAANTLDVPWLPLFLLALGLVHPLFLILIAVASTLFLILHLVGSMVTRTSKSLASEARGESMDALRSLEREGPMAELMSIGGNLSERYLKALNQHRRFHETGSTRSTAFDSAIKFLRSALQIAALSLGAYLVTLGNLTPGGMIGASIIIAKTLGIIETTMSTWPHITCTWQAVKALNVAQQSGARIQTSVGDLSGLLKAQNLTYPRGGGAPPRIERVSLELKPGECLAILGESGSGKTTLLHALAGIDPAPIGNCFVDETDVRTLDTGTRDAAIGYLPQQANFISGTIADNIARFAFEHDDEKVLAASRMAGVHGLISGLPDAYDTDIGAAPYILSAGQKQRIALARALYEPPKYLFLDEPNALLDHNAERQLGDAIARLKADGTTIILVAHRMSIVNLADKVIVLEQGRVLDYGPRAEILGRMANSHRRLRLPIAGSVSQDLSDWVARQFVRSGDEDFSNRANVIANEMYNFARENGPKSPERMLHMEFKFIDDNTCSITLSEPRKAQFEAKISKVRKAVELSMPNISDDLSSDEQSLAMVMKLSDRFEHQARPEQTSLFARIIQNTPSPEVMQ